MKSQLIQPIRNTYTRQRASARGIARGHFLARGAVAVEMSRKIGFALCMRGGMNIVDEVDAPGEGLGLDTQVFQLQEKGSDQPRVFDAECGAAEDCEAHTRPLQAIRPTSPIME